MHEPHITEYFGGRRVDSLRRTSVRNGLPFFVAFVDGNTAKWDRGADRNEAVNNALTAFPDKTKKKPKKKKGKKK